MNSSKIIVHVKSLKVVVHIEFIGYSSRHGRHHFCLPLQVTFPVFFLPFPLAFSSTVSLAA